MLRDTIKKEMKTLLEQYKSGELSDEDILKELNSAVFYNVCSQPYIYELFIMVALENKIEVRSPYILSMLFQNSDVDCFLVRENAVYDGTRMKYLQFLKLDETVRLYNDFLADTGFVDVDEDNRRKHFDKKISLEDVRISLFNEVKK